MAQLGRVFGLSEEYESLLKDLCIYCTAASRLYYPESGSYVTNWEGKVFYEFIVRRNDLRSKIKDGIEKNLKIKFSTLEKAASDGIGAKTAFDIFILSASVYGRTPADYLRDYVEFCKKHKAFRNEAYRESGYVHRGLVGHETTIDELLNQSKSKGLPVQDIISIKKEIESIREELGLYPHGKELLRFDESFITKASSTFSHINNLLTELPDHSELLSFKAYILGVMKRNDEAFEIAKKAYSIDPESEKAVLCYGIQLCRKKNYKEAKKLYDNAKNKLPNSPLVFYSSGNLQAVLGNHVKAIKDFQAAIGIDSEFVRPYFQLAKSLMKLGRFSESEVAIKKVLSFCPNDLSPVSLLVSILEFQGRKHELEDIILEYCESVDAEKSELFIDVFGVLESKNPLEIIGVLTEKIRKLEADPIIWKDMLGALYSSLGDAYLEAELIDTHELARDCYLSGLKYQPDSPHGLHAMAKYYLDRSNYDQALFYIRKALDNISRRSDQKEFCIRLSAQIESIGNELFPFQCFLEYIGEDVEIFIQISEFYLKNNNISSAKEYAEKACSYVEKIAVSGELSFDELSMASDVASHFVLLYERLSEEDLKIKTLHLFDICMHPKVKEDDHAFWRETLYEKCEFLLKVVQAEKSESSIQDAINSHVLAINVTSRVMYRDTWLYYVQMVSSLYDDLWKLDGNVDHVLKAVEYGKKQVEELSRDCEFDKKIELEIRIAKLLRNFGIEKWTLEPLREAFEILENIYNSLDAKKMELHYLDINFQMGVVCHDIYDVDGDYHFLEKAEAHYLQVTADGYSVYYSSYAWRNLGQARAGIFRETKNIEVGLQAIDDLEKSIELFDKEGNSNSVSEALIQGALVYISMGEFSHDIEYFRNAINAYEQALCIYKSISDDKNIARCLYGIGYTKSLIATDKDSEEEALEAIEYFENSIAYYESSAQTQSALFSYLKCGEYYLFLERVANKAEYLRLGISAYDKAIEGYTKLNAWDYLGIGLHCKALCLMNLYDQGYENNINHIDLAIKYFSEALSYLSDNNRIVYSNYHLGISYYLKGVFLGEASWYEKALNCYSICKNTLPDDLNEEKQIKFTKEVDSKISNAMQELSTMSN